MRWLNKSFLSRATTLSLAELNSHALSAVQTELKQGKRWSSTIQGMQQKVKSVYYT
jgi:hypothetical protein